MSLLRDIGGAITSIADAAGVPGAGLANDLIEGSGGGSATPSNKNSPGHVVNRCPNAPSTELVRNALMASSATELAELRRLWVLANPTFNFDASIADPEFFATAMAGGDDCKVSSANGRNFATYAYAWLAKHPYGNTPLTLPNVQQPSVIQQVIDRAKDEVGKLPERIAEAATSEVARSVQTVTQPATDAVVTRKLNDALPYIAIGGIVVLIGVMVARGAHNG